MVTGFLATQEPVHTTGVNIASVLTIVSSCVVLISVIIGSFLRQQSKAISSAVNNLTTKLESTFESKEKVGNLAARVSFLEEKVADISHTQINSPK